MSQLLNLIEHYGLAAVFLNVLAEQLGAPLPAYPTLIITGALLHRSDYSASMLLLTTVSAALIADTIWYLAGKRYGRTVISMLCRISLSPDSCVRQTEAIYLRWRAPSLLVAKFIPGFASIGSALAGTLGTRPIAFLFFDSLGATVWAGSAIWLGSLFKTTISDLLAVLEQLGKWGLLLIGLALIAFIAKKWWQRERFLKALRMDRISVNELLQLRTAVRRRSSSMFGRPTRSAKAASPAPSQYRWKRSITSTSICRIIPRLSCIVPVPTRHRRRAWQSSS